MEVSFVPQGTSDSVKGHFGCYSLGAGWGGLLLVSGVWRTGMSLNVLRMHSRVAWSRMSVVPRLRNHNAGVINAGLFHPEGYFGGKK